jgi:hypothetical protein
MALKVNSSASASPPLLLTTRQCRALQPRLFTGATPARYLSETDSPAEQGGRNGRRRPEGADVAEQEHRPGWWRADNGSWYPPNVRNPNDPRPTAPTAASNGASSPPGPVPPGAARAPIAGPVGYCPQCGTALATDNSYCAGCGRPLMAAAPAPQWPAQGGHQSAPHPQTAGSGYSTAGIVCGAIAFLFLPIVLGPAGLILGAVAKSRGERNAPIALWVAGLGTVVGMILGVMLIGSS